MSTARHRPHRRVWLRVLVLLLALLVSGGEAACAAPHGTVAAEHDVTAPAPRSAACRPAAPLRPAPTPRPRPRAAVPVGRPAARPPYTAPRVLRSVVLRC
ncbi:hypothetical protein AQJ30_27920 [Streptomyces longwoodensis]|uniref:Secreted protein n=1 Tax=Streptomyces longwoodensis TaxID=68231 RepID=A0A117QLG2_9ACTN|nr:hypothetical protein [Streptomyces longwoodensis]KUN34884.1 hypothetical protein AQJ30_27920 [Streptomyces longwoodensis]